MMILDSGLLFGPPYMCTAFAYFETHSYVFSGSRDKIKVK